jgi:type IV pilus assembly protein PilE
MKEQRGFSLIELMVVVAIVGILAAIVVPTYGQHIIKASRSAAQTDLMQMAALEEKIYLNSNSYTTSSAVTGAYTGQATGGLGWRAASSMDGKYNYACVCNAQDFAITATPVAGTKQAGDGSLTIDSLGRRLWTGGAKPTW